MSENQTGVRRAGRPRKARPETTVVEEKKEVSTISEEKGKFIEGVRGGKEQVIPYRGHEYIKPNESHYFVNGNPSVGYKLIRVYKDQAGHPKRALERTLKPQKHTKRGTNDRIILKQLKAAGVSGIL